MPWKENQVVDLRLEFVLASFEKGINFTQLCAEYGISTKCGYKWKERFLSEGKAGLLDKKRTPKNSPKKIPEDVVLELIKLSVWWLSLGIKLDRIEPGKPYQNGAHERMHKDMARELQHEIVGNITLHQKLFDKWRIEFNRERPHESLDMRTPEQVYVKSEKLFDHNADLLLTYPFGFKQRHVNDRGYINWLGHLIMIGNPFNGFNVGIKREGDHYSIWFANNKLGVIDNDFFLLISDPDSYKAHKPRKVTKKRYPSTAA